jgi:hypothetical protein
MKPDFSKAQNEATKLLLKQNFNSLNIDVRTFKFDRNIKIDSIQHYAKIVNKNVSDFCCSELSGCLVLKVPKFGLSIILYDDSEKNERRKHWGIVHEIGHIYLDHTSDGDVQEIEANFFAAQIVTPEIVLINFAKMQGGHLSSDDIYENFNCSSISSHKRIKTLSSYTWSYNEYDKMLLAKFKPIIKHFFKRKKMDSKHIYPIFAL